ncbi:NrsF family protein [Limnohabitans sp. 63ED37-2]|uniref:NrsF family protein n=1 Tax=Limnohabitans sp. 63ED37-2 TaxID=1678128 RepID=UPI0007064518|nr:DUF1109 domain-containing protein [Limnohabitans sp. 63ED37-2]ALK90250.1 hypothetical protein L63ED372_03052 [Limnohabitans sp. 63ED37-2]
MKTNDLIALLASDTLQPQIPVRQQLLRQLLLGAVVCGVLLFTLFGLNPQMDQMAVHPAFITKMMWLTALMGFSLYGLFRLARPGVGAGHTLWGIGLALLAMFSLGLLQLLQTDSGAQTAQWMGGSWQVCSVSITALSLPVLGALLWALRQLAPTRPVLTGAVAGVLAGSLAASIYSLHCTETSLTFFAVWYVAGMALATGLGALLGTRWLRW